MALQESWSPALPVFSARLASVLHFQGSHRHAYRRPRSPPSWPPLALTSAYSNGAICLQEGRPEHGAVQTPRAGSRSSGQEILGSGNPECDLEGERAVPLPCRLCTQEELGPLKYNPLWLRSESDST